MQRSEGGMARGGCQDSISTLIPRKGSRRHVKLLARDWRQPQTVSKTCKNGKKLFEEQQIATRWGEYSKELFKDDQPLKEIIVETTGTESQKCSTAS